MVSDGRDHHLGMEGGARRGFWARQIAEPRTRVQLGFDLLFGAFLPVLCLAYDPIVFRGGVGLGGGLLTRWALGAYVATFLGIVALWLWLLLGRPAPLLAGSLLGASVVALAIGLALLPLSLLFAVAGIGLLGLVPLATAFVYARNGVRALRRVPAWRRLALLALAAGLLLSLALPLAVHRAYHRALERTFAQVVAGGEGSVDDAVAHLRAWRWVYDPESLVQRWSRETDPDARQRLALVYERFTGRRVEYDAD